ncbi:DUF6432 family protein [Halococcoides cellulosivorans]|uniref:MarR family transcriptional regulator n=1 Tax=Halococcoides cellulosivorans TaxID=1679096 RepID=A0A2R4WXN9_9EURY|nr:DUF6432 family protein [Halococcoides cellulosivorans]AWB26307.1 MarR family transcriptional regulator [Halococcoides cellulosivorans]
MRATPEHRDRPAVEVAVLDALAARAEEGLTVFELRSRVDHPIDDLEDALAALDRDDLITVESEGERTVIRPREHAIGPEEENGDAVDRLREWLFG